MFLTNSSVTMILNQITRERDQRLSFNVEEANPVFVGIHVTHLESLLKSTFVPGQLRNNFWQISRAFCGHLNKTTFVSHLVGLGGHADNHQTHVRLG
jgi:hypothetical protein